MSHAYSDVHRDNTEGRKISGMLNHGHLSQADNELSRYGKSHDISGVAHYLQRHHDNVSVEHDQDGHVTALQFGNHDIYGISSGKQSRSRAEHEAGGKERGAIEATKEGTDTHTSDAKNDSAPTSGDQPRGSVTDNGRGRKEYSEQLPPNWGSMSDRERQAWMSQYQQRANAALHIGGPPRLGVDPDTGVWTGYAGEEPTAAEKKKMEEIERDPRKMHYV